MRSHLSRNRTHAGGLLGLGLAALGLSGLGGAGCTRATPNRKGSPGSTAMRITEIARGASSTGIAAASRPSPRFRFPVRGYAS